MDQRPDGRTARVVAQGWPGWPSWPHHSSAGTIARASATCSPQPAQVVLPQSRQVVGWHMGLSRVVVWK
ncbi:hypothetical protein GCM10027270_16000 [Nocardioides ginkgobilobae]